MTWSLGERQALRGCIGTFGPYENFYETLAEFARASASRDTRFQPISPWEAHSGQLSVTVSLLVDFEHNLSLDHIVQSWDPVTEGISIEFSTLLAGDDGARDDGARDDGARDDSARGDGARGDRTRIEAVRRKKYHATYLPDVTPSLGWDVQRVVAELCRKSGYGGAVTDGLLRQARFTTYRSVRASMTHKEYLRQCRRDDRSLDAACE